MIQEIKDEILENEPRYRMRDSNGNIIQNNISIEQITPVIQEGTEINKGMLNNIQGDLYTQDRYNKPVVTLENGNYTNNLSLPLTSYEVGKIVNIEGSNFEDITSFENPYININDLGAKQINGTIEAGEKYSLIYNGESWDFIKPYKIIKGTYTGNAIGNTFSSQIISLENTPKAIIVYNTRYKYSMVAIKDVGSFGTNIVNTTSNSVGDLGYSSDTGDIAIVENGFQVSGTGQSGYAAAYGFNSNTSSYNYIAIF